MFQITVTGKMRSWLGPNTFITGAPEPRDALGFTAAGGMIYVFGGYATTGGNFVNLMNKTFQFNS